MSVPVDEKSSTGLPTNLAAALCYPLGVFTGVAFLVLEKESAFVRFHALQATLASIVVTVLREGAQFSPLPAPDLLTGIATVALFAWMIVCAIRGEAYELPWVGPAARARLDSPTS